MKVWGCKDVGFGIWEWEGFGVSPVSEKGFRDLGFREREREREEEEEEGHLPATHVVSAPEGVKTQVGHGAPKTSWPRVGQASKQAKQAAA